MLTQEFIADVISATAHENYDIASFDYNYNKFANLAEVEVWRDDEDCSNTSMWIRFVGSDDSVFVQNVLVNRGHLVELVMHEEPATTIDRLYYKTEAALEYANTFHPPSALINIQRNKLCKNLNVQHFLTLLTDALSELHYTRTSTGNKYSCVAAFARAAYKSFFPDVLVSRYSFETKQLNVIVRPAKVSNEIVFQGQSQNIVEITVLERNATEKLVEIVSKVKEMSVNTPESLSALGKLIVSVQASLKENQ